VRNEGSGQTGTVLNDADDRFTLNFALHSSTAAADKLVEGEEVTIKINTQAGGTTTIRFTVPESLNDKSSVLL
jgi:flagellin FlaA/flagellin FlaB